VRHVGEVSDEKHENEVSVRVYVGGRGARDGVD
jgi:hypothetical protein